LKIVWVHDLNNLYERVEVMFPIKRPHLRERLFDEILQSYLKDTDKARMLRQDGTMHAFYTPAIPDSGVTAIVLVHRSFSLTWQSKDTSPQKPKQRTSPTSLPIDVKNNSPQPARVCDMSSSFPDPRRRDASALEEFIA
jgi:hypothetical protein